MTKKFDNIIFELESEMKKLEDDRGITITPINESLANLKRHHNNIRRIEENIYAIKEEIISEIKHDLERSRKSGKFSIWGFYIGFTGFIVTILGLIYSFSFNTKKVIAEISRNHADDYNSFYGTGKKNSPPPGWSVDI